MSIKTYPHNKLIVILGPTASGKSELSVKLAKKFNGEVISADSRQIYQEMTIGTAKVTKREMDNIPHYMTNIIKPDQEFSLAQFKQKAIKIIKDIQKRDKIPFLVGGTGLYIQSIVDNLDIPDVKPDKKLRDKLEKLSNQELLSQLKKLDPDTANSIDYHNKRRLIRALEVCLITKKPFSKQRKKGKILFNTLQIGINPDKKILEQRISQRADKMIKKGLIEEIEKLLTKYKNSLPSLNSIGYAEIIQYLEKKTSLDQAKNLINRHSLQYAKRQITWFKRDKRIHWIQGQNQAEKLIKDFIGK